MYTCTYKYNQSFHQYSYGFQNLMSSFKIWCQVGVRGQKFKNYSRYVTFLLVGLKVRFWNTRTSCNFENHTVGGFCSKISTLRQVGDFLGLKVRFWNTRMWFKFGNRKQPFYGFVVGPYLGGYSLHIHISRWGGGGVTIMTLRK